MAPKNFHEFRRNTFSFFEKHVAFMGAEAPRKPEVAQEPEYKVEADKENVVKALKERTGEIRRRLARLEAKKGALSYAKIEGRVAKLKNQLTRIRNMLSRVEKGRVELSQKTIERIENLTNRTVRKPLEGAALERAFAKADRTLDFDASEIVGKKPRGQGNEWAVDYKGSTGKGAKKVSKYEGHEVKLGGKGRMSDAARRAALRDSGYSDAEIAAMEDKKPETVGAGLPKQEVAVFKRPNGPDGQPESAGADQPKLEGQRTPREIADERDLRDWYTEQGVKLRRNPEYAQRVLRNPELLKGYAADMKKDPEIAKIIMGELNKDVELAQQFAQALEKGYPQIIALLVTKKNPDTAKDEGKEL